MTSRIIVKNLPKRFSEDRFREHFSTKGEVTDARLMFTKRGTFRRFGYIGYRTEEEAQEAQKYFDRSFIDTSRIEVEIAKPYGDTQLPRAWSVYTKGTTLFNKAHGVNTTKTKEKESASEDAVSKGKSQKKNAIRSLYEALLADNQDDPRFNEFLQVMAPRAHSKTWANDDGTGLQDNELDAVKKAAAARREQVEGSSNPKSDTQDDAASEGNASDDGEAKVADSGLSDLDWLRMHMSSGDNVEDAELDGKVLEHSEAIDAKEADNEGNGDGVATAGEAESGVKSKTVAQIEDTGRLFLRNLPYLATEDDLRKAFEQFGPLAEVHMPISKDSKKPKGFAYILYLMPEHAVQAYKAMDNKVFLGRLLHVLPGKEKPQAKEGEDSLDGFKSSLKKERDSKKKNQAGSDFNWNSLYMSADAVADSIADRLSISKAELLDADTSSNPAVRLALAETHIINDTKRFFEEQGVMLEQFGHRERSDTIILVKNIPFSVDEEELRSLFAKYGSLGRVLVPPSRTIAIVEFLEPSEARSAFRNLAYKRLKDAPIYLERAPAGIFETDFDPSMEAERLEKSRQQAEVKRQAEQVHEPINDPTAASHVSAQGSSSQGEAGRVLFVKNLNFDTTEDTLKELFGGVDGLASVTVRRKKDPKRPGKWLSMGFGFVEYKTADGAQQALKSYQGVEVDDHALEIKMSDRLAKSSADNDQSAASKGDGKKPKGTKIVVKNIPFEASRKDIQDLISTFGQIKSIRLPKKFSGGHRGFAFVEFLTPQEAQHVLDTVKDTHLYGRHLVLDWAEEENSLQAIREKVGRQFAKDEGTSNPGSKRRKLESDLANRGDSDLMNMDSDDDDDDE
ncbi:Multiple RNA-binding domain-containing protein 1 [Dipsacomyces acuminosporus]|nr:Multiple RNA-binding domain-containing protein 1 [Dipsacomyces acuminosporus]